MCLRGDATASLSRHTSLATKHFTPACAILVSSFDCCWNVTLNVAADAHALTGDDAHAPVLSTVCMLITRYTLIRIASFTHHIFFPLPYQTAYVHLDPSTLPSPRHSDWHISELTAVPINRTYTDTTPVVRPIGKESTTSRLLVSSMTNSRWIIPVFAQLRTSATNVELSMLRGGRFIYPRHDQRAQHLAVSSNYHFILQT